MRKIAFTVVAAALLPGVAPLAYAQSAAAAPPATIGVADTGGIIRPDQIRASKMIGGDVYDVQNRDVGSIKDVILDRDGRVAAVVVDVGAVLGMGGKYVAVPLRRINTDNNRITLDLTKEQLVRAPSYRLEDADTGAGSTATPPVGGHLGSVAGPHQ